MELSVEKQKQHQIESKENSKQLKLENEPEVDVLVTQEATVENQNKFLDSLLGKTINSAIDMGLKSVLPDFIENQIIDIKNAMLTSGLKEGINTAVNSAIQLGKSILGIATGKFEDLSQVHTAIKKGGIIDSLSSLMDNVVGNAQKKNQISTSTGRAIKKGKNAILSTISANLEEAFFGQINAVEKVSKYIESWKGYFHQRDFEGMEKEYQKIKVQLSSIMALDSTIAEAKKIENVHNLLKNKGKNYVLSEEEEKLIELLK